MSQVGTQMVESALRRGRTRDDVLLTLQQAARALAVAEVAERLDLHPNSARFHLDGLVDSGEVERGSEPRTGPGRPRALYRARGEAPEHVSRRYRLLAEMLAGIVETAVPDPAATAELLGESWARGVVREKAHRPGTGPTAEPADAPRQDVVEALIAGLDDAGFTASAHRVGEGDQIRLEMRRCPFLDVARHHQTVVCSLHRGLIRGLLADRADELRIEELVPFVEPDVCVAHLHR